LKVPFWIHLLSSLMIRPRNAFETVFNASGLVGFFYLKSTTHKTQWRLSKRRGIELTKD